MKNSRFALELLDLVCMYCVLIYIQILGACPCRITSVHVSLYPNIVSYVLIRVHVCVRVCRLNIELIYSFLLKSAGVEKNVIVASFLFSRVSNQSIYKL